MVEPLHWSYRPDSSGPVLLLYLLLLIEIDTKFTPVTLVVPTNAVTLPSFRPSSYAGWWLRLCSRLRQSSGYLVLSLSAVCHCSIQFDKFCFSIPLIVDNVYVPSAFRTLRTNFICRCLQDWHTKHSLPIVLVGIPFINWSVIPFASLNTVPEIVIHFWIFDQQFIYTFCCNITDWLTDQ